MENEIWKDIPGYEGRYKISNYGKVLGVKRNKILKNSIDRRGYSYVSLYKDRTEKRTTIHRLVALTFVPNPENKPYVCHKVAISNGGDNSVNNLYWGTVQDNANDRTRDGNHSKAMEEKTGKPVLQIDKNTKNIINEYNSISEAASAINGHIGNICSVCNGTRKTANGYIWKYKN